MNPDHLLLLNVEISRAHDAAVKMRTATSYARQHAQCKADDDITAALDHAASDILRRLSKYRATIDEKLRGQTPA